MTAAMAMLLPHWEPHPEIWLLVALLEGGYLWAVTRLGPRVLPAGVRAASRRQALWFTLGVVSLWLATDWPLDTIADGYLFSVHMLQHMLLGFAAAPLMLLGTPDWLLRRLIRPRAFHAVLRQATRPFIAMVLFNMGIVVLHWPLVMGYSLQHEWFHFLVHAMVYFTALCMWWPIISPLPEMPTLSYPARMLYLFLQSIVPTVPASFLTFGHSLLYRFYGDVPRLWGLSAMTDQLISGLVMKLAGGAEMWIILAVIFFRWYGQEQTEGWDALQFRGVERDVQSAMARQRPREHEVTR